uniref:SH3 domain-containing protein n=1 Tax=Monopterus albus TaxID=43700 RepID=A0A3Q3IJ58_MONAL
MQDGCLLLFPGKEPQKPPRSSLLKVVNREPVTETDRKDRTNITASTNTENQSDSKPNVKQPNQSESTNTCNSCVTVLWNIPSKHLPTETTTSSSDSEPSKRPIPLPRIKSQKQAVTEKVQIQTLVKLSENCDSIHPYPQEVSLNKYLKELLEVFSAEYELEENGDITNQSDVDCQGEDAFGKMSMNNSQRNIRARIQAFESQACTEDGNVAEPAEPALQPRRASFKPSVAAKPSVALKPQFNHNIENNDSQNISITNVPQSPTPVNRPQTPMRPVGMSIKGELEAALQKGPISNRPSPSVLSRANSIFEAETSPIPPTTPVNLFKEPLKPNLYVNNHNSASIFSENEYVSFPSGKEASLNIVRPSTAKQLPPRPSPAKTGPGRPPLSSHQDSASWEASPKPQPQKTSRKGPVLPPRPNPGHRLYNKYTLQVPHGIAACNYNGNSTGELSFQKNEVLLLLEEIDHNTFECEVGDARGRVHKSRMTVITPLDSDMSPPQALHDFIPGELGLRAGDVVTMVEQVDSEWYRGTCRGSTGFFPVSYVKVLVGERGDELSFSEGDVIQLKEYVGQDWARGQIGTLTGIFPLNFVEVTEDLPPPPSQVAEFKYTESKTTGTNQASQFSVDWVVALHDYDGNSGEDLSFRQGDRILVTQYIDAEWSYGRLNGKEGMFPRAFVENQYEAAGGGRARALYTFTSECDEELSLQVGDIITNLESVDGEWFLGELRGKRALVPKNYVQVLAQ